MLKIFHKSIKIHSFLNLNIKLPFSKNKDTKVIQLVYRKLSQLSKQYTDLQQKLINSPNQNDRQGTSRKRLNKLSQFVSLYDKVDAALKNIQQLQKLKTQNKNDKQTIDFANQQIQKFNQQLDQLQKISLQNLIQPSLYDDYNQVNIQFRPGVGGSQSSLFVQDAVNMYQAYFARIGWNSKFIESQKDFNVNKGYKYCCIKVVGQNVYKILKCQSGIHKVIRVPQTQSKGRLHSSTISVVVMPSIPFDFSVNDKDIRYEFTRAQGAGGQHVNKTQSACKAIHIPTGLNVFIQQDRVQERNRKKAVQLLKQKVFQLQFHKNMQAQAARRKIQIGTGDRSQKIRTYNYPQDRITDHRTGLTLYGIQKMMSGQYLQVFIKQYQDKLYRIKLEKLLESLKNE